LACILVCFILLLVRSLQFHVDLLQCLVAQCSVYQSPVGSVLCGSSSCLITAVHRHVFRTLRFHAESPNLLLVQRYVVLRPTRSLRFTTMWLDHCGSSLYLLHSPCSITAFQHHVARNCGSTLDLLRPAIYSSSALCGSSPYPISHYHVASLMRFLAGSPSAPLITAVPRWISLSTLRFSVLCLFFCRFSALWFIALGYISAPCGSVFFVSLSRVVVNFPDKPIRLGLNEDLFHYGERACSQEQRNCYLGRYLRRYLIGDVSKAQMETLSAKPRAREWGLSVRDFLASRDLGRSALVFWPNADSFASSYVKYKRCSQLFPSSTLPGKERENTQSYASG
jgi:hypothetical protein